MHNKNMRYYSQLFTLLAGLAICSVVMASPPAAYFVPFQLSNLDHVLIRARINGHGPYTFIMDTGAPTVFITPKIAKLCGVTKDEKGWGHCKEFHVEGGLHASDVLCRVEEPAQLQGMNSMGLSAEPLDGVIGYTFLSHYKITIDLSRQHMRWIPVQYTPLVSEDSSLLGDPAIEKEAKQVDRTMKNDINTVTSMISKQKRVKAADRPLFGIKWDPGTQPVIGALLKEGPAELAGLQPGDKVIRILLPGKSAKNVPTQEAARKILNMAVGASGVVVVVLRAGTRMKYTVYPEVGGM